MISQLVPAAVVAAILLPSASASAGMVPDSTPISIAMSPASPRAGSAVHFTGGAGASSYAWDLDGDGQFDDAIGKDATASFGAGTQTVRAQAVTAVGLLTDSRTFTVHAWNVAPGGTVGAIPYSARVGSPVTIKAEGRDPDGPGVQVALDLDGDGAYETAGFAGTATFATPGERVIRARFTDDAGATSVATTTLDVHAGNIAPTARIVPPPVTVASATAEPPSGWTVAAVDPDGEIVRYEYDVDGDGTYETDRGRDARMPQSAADAKVVNVRVTDDSGATGVDRASSDWAPPFPRVVQAGAPVTLSLPDYITGASWDTDGDGDFDDGTGRQLSFTFPSAGSYAVRVQAMFFGRPGVFVETVSARDAADIAVPTVRWASVPPVRPDARASLGFAASGPTGVETSVDLDGNGVFGDTPAVGGAVWWLFGGPATIALKATDARGRAAVTTTEVPFVTGDLGPDATLSTFDNDHPLQAAYPRATLSGGGADPDEECCVTTAWDTDDDGDYDDGQHLFGSIADGSVAASVGLRVTDRAGVSTTLRRTVAQVTPVSTTKPPTPQPATSPWLRLTPQRPHLASLLRRGLTVKVTCSKPGCRTKLVAKVDAKTARTLKLRSRIVASRTVAGTRQVRLTLTPKARRALKHARSLKLTLTATATAPGAPRASLTTTLTIRR
jgi:YD repeat-containing protein